MVVKLRNISKETIKVSAQPLWMSYPGVVDARGNRVRKTTPPPPLFSIILKSLTLKPGETVDVGKTDLLVTELDQQVRIPDGVVDMCTIHVAPGNHKADCTGFLKEHPTLATGTVEFEVKPAKDESFTAWGKEAGGLQAGLGFRPGAHRGYHHGETVTLVVRVRNVGKETVKFQYLNQFFIERPPTVTDAESERVPVEGVTAFGRHIPVDVTLTPGKEIELYELKLALRPGDKVGPFTLSTMGKVSVQYERVFGNSSSGSITLDPALSKPATGKLELEIKPVPPPAAAEKK